MAIDLNKVRVIDIFGRMRIHDDEPWPIKDKNYTRTRQFPQFHLYAGKLTAHHVWKEGAGGEIRAEVHLNAALNTESGAVNIHTLTKLYEGLTESTGDLAGVGEKDLHVAKGKKGLLEYTVKSEDSFLGSKDNDRVKLALNITNRDLKDVVTLT